MSICRLFSIALVAFSPLLASAAANAQAVAPSLAARASLAPPRRPLQPLESPQSLQSLQRLESLQQLESLDSPQSPRATTFAPDPALLPARARSLSRADESDEKPATHFKTRFVLGFVTSILAHEAGHVVASYAVGGHPYFGFDKGRPTIYSGLDANLEPHKQFIFSSAGLTVQTLMDEVILDVPHDGGGAFERGLLAGGIATTAFYITLGRNASVSDVTFMARTSSLSKTQVSLIFGTIAAAHALRIHFDDHYAHFFAAPTEREGLRVGVVVR